MIHAIVLAAGRSRRMGKRVQKLLLPFGGDTVIGRVAGEVGRSPVDRPHVVVGADSDRVQRALSGRAVDIIRNPDPTGDMLSSVRCGLRALPPQCEGILVALGDQPAISADIISDMVEYFREVEQSIVVPTFDGERGHPLLFDGAYRDEIVAAYDEVGLRGLVRAHPGEVHELPTGDSAVLSDMDYPEDYRRELARYADEEDSG